MLHNLTQHYFHIALIDVTLFVPHFNALLFFVALIVVAIVAVMLFDVVLF